MKKNTPRRNRLLQRVVSGIRFKQIALLSFFAFALCIRPNLATGQTNTEPLEVRSITENAQAADSTKVWPQKLSGKSTWEKIVSVPGQVLYLPIELTLEIPKQAIGLAYQGKFIYQVMDFLVADDGSKGILPVYKARTGGGLKFFHKGFLSNHTSARLILSGGTLQRQYYALKINQGFSGTFQGSLFASYTKLPNEYFYGIGNESEENGQTNFTREISSFGAAIDIGLRDNLALDVTVGVDFNNIFAGRSSSQPQVGEIHNVGAIPGFENKIELGKVLAKITYDYRNRPGSPTKGLRASFGSGIFTETGDEKYEFYQFTTDVTTYLHLFYNRYLVLRAAGQVSRPFSNREVPFTYFSELGEEETIRGFRRGRFIDRDMVLSSIEYRWPVHERIDATLFVDAGKVAHDIFDEFSGGDFHTGYGFGLRFWNKAGLLTKVQIAKSKDGFHFYLDLN